MAVEVPDKWQIKSLSDLVDIKRGISWSNDQEVPEGTPDAYPVLGIPNVQEKLELSDIRFIHGVDPKKAQSVLAKKGWALMVGSNGNPKRVGNCVYINETGSYLFASFLLGLHPIDSKVLQSEFMFRLLWSEPIQKSISDSVQGSTGLKNISVKMLRDEQVLLPPLSEQKKIAEILESMDDAIVKTESVIAQTQRVKLGLLQQLLTRGIGHTKFKQSPLGEIPESWEIKTLADTGKWSGGGTPSKQNPNFWVGSIPWVSPKDMKAKVITETEDYISNEAIQGSATSLLPKGTILIVTRSGILRHTLPIAIAGVDLAVNQDLKTIQVCSPFLMKFVFYWLQSNSEKILKECSKEGTTVESIETDTFKKFLITMPPKDEQQKIISIIDSLQNFDEAEIQKLKFLRTIKSGLMSDLLTGRVRVKVDTNTLNKIEEAA